MNSRQKFTLHLLIYIVLCSAGFAQVVEIPDPNLRRAVRGALNLPAGTPVTQADMRQLTKLDARQSQIQELTGLEYATNLAFLVLGGNNISNLTPLAGLAKLETLWLWDNPLPDLSPLANLINLEDVDLSGCQISDISPLANFTQLLEISMADNGISDLTPFAGLVQLEFLWLWNNPLSNLSPLANLTALKHLNLSRCQISDIAPLANLKGLSELYLGGNRIVDVRPLANLTALRSLEIDENLINDYSPLDTLSLTHFIYDQSCEVPPLPLQPRLENRTFPSVFAAWGGIGWSPVLNQPHLSDLEQMSQHDLYFCCLMFGQHFFNTGVSWEVRGDLGGTEQLRDDYIALNPNMIFLAGIEFRAALLEVNIQRTGHIGLEMRKATLLMLDSQAVLLISPIPDFKTEW